MWPEPCARLSFGPTSALLRPIAVKAPPLDPRVHHLAVKVQDLERAERFYGGVLGLEVVRRQSDARGPRSIWLALGPKSEEASRRPFLAVERADRAGPLRSSDAPGFHCVALGIDAQAREAWRRHLADAGHEVFHETDYTLYVHDPEGSVIALSHHPHPANSSPGPTTAPLGGGGGVGIAAALLALLAILVVASGVERGQAQARHSRAATDVLIVGSSSVNGALGRLIESELARGGFHPERRARSSSGFSRPDFYDWEAAIPSLGDLHALRGIVVYAGGNDAQAIRLREGELPAEARADRRVRSSAEWIVWRDEARWRSTYEARVRSFVDGLCAAGAPRVLVLLPAEGENERWSERMERIQELQASATRASRCGRVLDPRGVRVREGATVDGIHLSRTGARAVWERVGASVLEALRAR